MKDVYNSLDRKIRIGISACAYGAKTRYNRKGWDFVQEFGREMNNYIWVPVCPEAFSGMGTPRSQIRIQGDSGKEVLEGKARIVSREGKDVTRDIIFGCEISMQILKKANIDAYIYMDGSPTCGIERTSLKNNRVGKPPGVFGAMLLQEDIFLIPALSLLSPVKRWDYKRRLAAFCWTKEVQIESAKELYTFWHTMKFMCQELDENHARSIGKELAEIPYSPELGEKTKKRVLEILKKPSTLEKIKNRLWKHYSYIKKSQGIEIEEVLQPQDARNMHHIARELELLERYAFNNDALFGATPIR